MNKTKKQLMKDYSIQHVGGGTFGEGFFGCLDFFDNYIEEFLGGDVYGEWLQFVHDKRIKAQKTTNPKKDSGLNKC